VTLINKRLVVKKVVFIYQRMLPYHRARFNAVSKLAATANCVFHAIEICSMDGSYGDIGNGTGLDSSRVTQ